MFMIQYYVDYALKKLASQQKEQYQKEKVKVGTKILL
jgi:hypothetical protein